MKTEEDRLNVAAQKGVDMIIDAADLRTVIVPSREAMNGVEHDAEALIVTSLVNWALIEVLLPPRLRRMVSDALSSPLQLNERVVVRQLRLRSFDLGQRKVLIEAYCTVVPYVTKIETTEDE